MKKHSFGKIVLACIPALLAGLGQPLFIALSVMCVFGTILTPVFFAWAGFIPAAVYAGASLFSMTWLYGPAMAAAFALIVIVPSAVLIGMMLARQPFARRLVTASLAQLLCILALIAALYAVVRQDLIQALFELAQNWVTNLPPILSDVLLQQFALTGAMSEATMELVLSGSLAHEQVIDMLMVLLKGLSESLRLQLPGILLSSGVLTGVLAASFSGKICARRGDDIDYLTLDKWFMPRQVTIGALVCLATSLVLVWMRTDGAEAVYNAFIIAASTLYMVGGAASLCRRFKANGRSHGFRAAMVILGILFASTFLSLIGVFSALLGQKGIISTFIRKKAEEQDNDDQNKED